MYHGQNYAFVLLSTLCSTYVCVFSALVGALEDCLVCLIILCSFHSTCPKMLEGSSKGKMMDHQCVKYCWAHFIYICHLVES